MKFSDQKNQNDVPMAEASGKTFVFTFGRFQPPTSGHQRLVEKLSSVASREGVTGLLYGSKTQDSKKNPFPFAIKRKWLQRFFGKSVTVPTDSSVITVFDALNKFQDQGATKVILVIGGDRVEEMKKMVTPYTNGSKPPDKSYSFKFSVESAGERDPDAEGVVGMSASKMREAVTTGNFEAFKKGIPTTANEGAAKEMWNDLKKYMGIKEDVEEGYQEPTFVGEITRPNGKLKFWFDEKREIFYSILEDDMGNMSEDISGSMETVSSFYPEAWRLLLQATVNNIYRQRAHHRRVHNDEFEEHSNSILKPWMLKLQENSLKENYLDIIRKMNYITSVPCSKRQLPMEFLNNRRIVDEMVKEISDYMREYQIMIPKVGMTPYEKEWSKRITEFSDLMQKAVRTKKESDWKALQLYGCKHYDMLDSMFGTKTKAILFTGPA